MPIASILLQELERCKLASGQAIGTRRPPSPPSSTWLVTEPQRTPQGPDESWTPGLIRGATQAHSSIHNTGSSREPTPPTKAAGPVVDRTQCGTRGGSGGMTARKRGHGAQHVSRGLSRRPRQLPL